MCVEIIMLLNIHICFKLKFLQVIHMLLLILLVFFLSWAPILIFNLLASFELLGQDNKGTSTSTKHIKTAFSLLSYINRLHKEDSYQYMYAQYLFSAA